MLSTECYKQLFIMNGIVKALWIVLTETIDILRKFQKTKIYGMPPKMLP